jgi:hypothetical protein
MYEKVNHYDTWGHKNTRSILIWDFGQGAKAISARCYVILTHTTYISECVWIIEMYQVEHGEGMCYDSWV